MKISSSSLAKICQQISQKKPTPGGGSAVALAGALASSLVVKITNFTLGKKKFKAIDNKVTKIRQENLKRRNLFLKLAEDDCTFFRNFTKDRKNQSIIQNLIQVPLEVSRQALLVFSDANYLSLKGNLSLIADSRAAMELANASFFGALEIVRVNLPLLQKESDFDRKTREKIEGLLNQAQTIIKPA